MRRDEVVVAMRWLRALGSAAPQAMQGPDIRESAGVAESQFETMTSKSWSSGEENRCGAPAPSRTGRTGVRILTSALALTIQHARSLLRTPQSLWPRRRTANSESLRNKEKRESRHRDSRFSSMPTQRVSQRLLPRFGARASRNESANLDYFEERRRR